MKDIKDRIIEKQDEVIKHLGKLVLSSGYEIIEHNSKWMRLRKELADLKSQLSEQDDICVCKEDYDVEIISMEPPCIKMHPLWKIYLFFS